MTLAPATIKTVNSAQTSRTFSGLTSVWTMPHLCVTENPLVSPRMKDFGTDIACPSLHTLKCRGKLSSDLAKLSGKDRTARPFHQLPQISF